MKKLLKLVIIFLIVNPSCTTDSDEEIAEITDEQIKEKVVNLHYDWAEYSQKHDYYNMVAISASGGNFLGMSNVCKEVWDRTDPNLNNETYYKFNGVYVEQRYVKNLDLIYVSGNGKMIQGENDGKDDFTFSFKSSVKLEGDDKLNDWKLYGCLIDWD